MSEESKVVICSSCSAENVEGSKFCTNCGQKLPEPMVPVYDAVEAEIIEEAAEPVFTEPVAEPVAEAENVYGSEPVYENPVTTEELNINYGEPVTGDVVETATPVYYSSGASEVPASTNQSKGFAIASMVCGILSILCCCSGWLGVILSIVAIVFGVLTIKNEYGGRSMAIAGIITGGIGILFFVILMVVGLTSGEVSDLMNELM